MKKSRPAALAAEVGRFCHALARTFSDFDRNDYLTYAGALAFFFLLSLFPLLIFIASTLAYIPIPDLFGQILTVMASIVPPDAMGVVRGVLSDVLNTNPELVSASVFGAIFAASGGFSAMITVLNIAYDVPESRPFWKKRLVSLGLTLLAGVAVAIAMVAMVLGPQFGEWLAQRLHLGWLFAAAWPYVRWFAIIAFTTFAVEIIYFIGPNVKQRFWAQIPGALLAVVSWTTASWALGWYLRSFANYNKTFGALGAVVALMLWFYVTALAAIFGAEMNAELLHARGKSLAPKESSLAA